MTGNACSMFSLKVSGADFCLKVQCFQLRKKIPHDSRCTNSSIMAAQSDKTNVNHVVSPLGVERVGSIDSLDAVCFKDYEDLLSLRGT